MAGEALFLGWGQVVRGREQLALEVFQESVAYYGKLQEEGKIERFDAVRSSPEFQRVVVRAGSIVDRLGVVSASGGDALAQQMALFGEVSQGLPQAE